MRIPCYAAAPEPLRTSAVSDRGFGSRPETYHFRYIGDAPRRHGNTAAVNDFFYLFTDSGRPVSIPEAFSLRSVALGSLPPGEAPLRPQCPAAFPPRPSRPGGRRWK